MNGPTFPGRRLCARVASALLTVTPLLLAGFDASLVGVNRVELHGQSNLGDWDCNATAVSATARVDADEARFFEVFSRFDAGPAGAPVTDFSAWGVTGPPRLRLVIPVIALDCGHAGMNHDLRRALNARQHPEIIFDLLQLNALRWISGGNYALAATGSLRLNGTVRPVDLDLRITRQPDRSFRVTAELFERMTQFGIRPPTGLFGIIRARDALRIRFALQFAGAAG